MNSVLKREGIHRIKNIFNIVAILFLQTYTTSFSMRLPIRGFNAFFMTRSTFTPKSSLKYLSSSTNSRRLTGS